uniref:Uncharacterized protein n=1 Tax=Arundo donax TaxID=35708 RepID=A0A0A9E3D5_ARUDO
MQSRVRATQLLDGISLKVRSMPFLFHQMVRTWQLLGEMVI